MSTTERDPSSVDDMMTPSRAGELASRGGDLAVQDDQIHQIERASYGEFETAVRRMLGLEDASDGEMRLFYHLCQKSGLDPFNKEIYMIGRNTEVASYEPVDQRNPDGQKRKVMRWVTKYAIQVAINGFRKRAREIADLKGIDLEMGDPLWCGDDGVWREVWPGSKPPLAAKFVVFRNGKPFSFIAHYDEFVQKTGGGDPNAIWKKMPRNQLRKCAEANAIQSAFPDELGGLILEDAAQHDIIDSAGSDVTTPERQAARRTRGVAGLRDAAAADAAVDDTPPYNPAREPTPAFGGLGVSSAQVVAHVAQPVPGEQTDLLSDTPGDARISDVQLQELNTLMTALGWSNKDRRRHVTNVAGHPVAKAEDLTPDEATQVIADLDMRNQLEVALAENGFDDTDSQTAFISQAMTREITDRLDLSYRDMQSMIDVLNERGINAQR